MQSRQKYPATDVRQHDLLGGEFDLRRKRRSEGRHRAPATRQRANRLGGIVPWFLTRTCRHRAGAPTARAQQRRRTEADVAVAESFSAPPRGQSSLDLFGAALPSNRLLTFAAIRHGESDLPDPFGRAGWRASSAFERARGHRNSARRRDQPGARAARVDIKMNARAIAVGSLARGRTQTDSAARSTKLPSPDPAGERAHVAGKGDVASSSVPRLAASCTPIGPARLEPVDRQRAQIDRPGRCRPIHSTP